MPSIEDWLQWKQRCALALCDPDTQSALQDFVCHRFQNYLEFYQKELSSDPDMRATSPASDAWHSFETYFYLNQTRHGKSYKSWLFARGLDSSHPLSPSLPAVESGVSLLLRDVVRERLRHEASPRRVRSLHDPVCVSTDNVPVTLEDLLPAAVDMDRQVEQHELEQLASIIINALSRRERIALLARECQMSCAHPSILKTAGCGKSMLAAAHLSALRRVAQYVRDVYPDESAHILASLTVSVFENMGPGVRKWALSEKGLSEFL